MAGSLAIALINLVPLRFSGFSTDGMKNVELLGGGSRAGRLCALERIAGAELIGLQRPRHWEESWIQDALSHPDGSYTHILANRLAYFWALDRGDVEAAASFLAQVIERRAEIPKHILAGFLLENAYFQARHGSDPLTARAWFEQAGGKTLEIHTRCRAQAAVLLAEGRIEEARECASRGLAALDGASPAGRVVAEEDWLREIERAACSVAPTDGSQPTAHC